MKTLLYIEIATIRLFTILIQLLFIKCVTNAISVDELGVYYFLLTASYTFNAILFVPLDYYQQSNLYKYVDENISIKSFFLLNRKMIVAFIYILIVGGVIVGVLNPYYCIVFVLTSLLSVGTYFSLLLRGFINNLNHRRRAAYNLLIESVSKIIFLYVFLFIFSPNPIIVLLALFSASCVAIFFGVIYVKKMPQYYNGNIVKIKINNILKFMYPISIGAIANWIQLQSYRLILVPMGFSEVVGFYATVSNIGNSGMNACSTIYNQLFLPDIYKTNGRFLSRYLFYAFVIILVVLCVSVILKETIVLLLTNAIYTKFSILILFGIIVEAGNFIVGALTTYLGIHNLTRSSLKVTLLGLMMFVLFFSFIFFFLGITPYTIGIPIVISQIFIVGYLGKIVFKIYKINSNGK